MAWTLKVALETTTNWCCLEGILMHLVCSRLRWVNMYILGHLYLTFTVLRSKIGMERYGELLEVR